VSRLDDLVRSLVPGGVSYVALGDVAKTVAGLSGKTKSDFTDGNARFVSYKNINKNLVVDQGANDFVKVAAGERQNQLMLGDVLFTGSSESVAEVGLSSVVGASPTEALYLNSFCFALRFENPNLLLPEFTKYLFRGEAVRRQIQRAASGVTRINLSKERFRKVRIAIPPTEVQREIAGILDRFTDLEAALADNLRTEQVRRVQQFDHYRDQLMTFAEEDAIQRIPLGEICGVSDGTHQTPKYTDEGVPFVSVENIRNLSATTKCISREDFERNYRVRPARGDVLMTRIGTIGACAIVDGDEPLAYYVTLALLRPDRSRINSRFLRHVIESQVGASELRKRTLTTAVPIKINLGDIGKIVIPVPSLREQDRIADLLEKFEAQSKELRLSLPAELDARRKQYEYYCDKLLTFREQSA